jgi:hypothetical protein
MPITKITIRKADRQTFDITESFKLLVNQQTYYTTDTLDVSGNTATVNLPSVESTVVDQAIAELSSRSSGWLKTINHIQPVNGQFLIEGDACFSWIPETTTVRTYPERVSGVNNTTTMRSYLEEKGGGLHILNMCAACGSCQPQAALRIMLENLKLKLNELKDKNLYDNSTATARRGILRSNTMAPDTACGIPIRSWITDTVSSTMLLGQYATCVNMWNYIAARAHSQVLVEPAPHDPTAILVRAKHAFPACLAGSPAHGTGGTVKCTIEIRRNNSPSTTNTDISVYVPPAATEFQPFTNANVGTNDVTVTHDMQDATHKTITTSTWQASVSGTYCVSVYFLPFNYAELKDQLGNVLSEQNEIIAPPANDQYHTYSTSTTVVDPNDGVGYPATRYFHGKATFTRYVKYNTSDTGQTPTGSDMYNKYKSYPSVVDDGAAYTWKVTVKWTTTGLEEVNGSTSTPVEYTTDKYIQTRRPRIPAANLLPGSGETDEYKLFTNMTLYNVSPLNSE